VPAHLSPTAVAAALALRDLSDPAGGAHAMQLLLAAVERRLTDAWHVPVRRHHGDRIVTVADHYDRLGYAPDAVARDARYTRYVDGDHVLRAHTSALIPGLLRDLADDHEPIDVVLSCPGVVYRRDVIDRTHVGEPHQVDLWRLRADGAPLGTEDLREQIALVVDAALPGRRWRTSARAHPYTTDGLQVDVADAGGWLEVGECGLAHPRVLARAGLDPRRVSGLAMGLGLDRLLMLRKGIGDIRLLRSTDPRVAAQMQDLNPYQPVSSMPPATRDLSLAVAQGTTAEDLGDRVREALGTRASAVESLVVLAETSRDHLPPEARARLGMRPGQVNLLVRVVLRDLHRTLTADGANILRDRVYAALHEGAVHQWARGRPPAA
jgi:phenylalanyl-tRNA synthetase alpha chain